MSAPRNHEREIFGDAIVLSSPAERAAYLDLACGSNAALRHKVEELLAADAEAGGFMGGVGDTEARPARQGPGVVVLGEPSSSRRFGDYQLLGEIARGGMGVVFRARQSGLDRTVALKMIASGHLASPSAVQRFRDEAEAAAQLDHPNIVPVYEVGECGGQLYFTMKLIEGRNLAEHICEGTWSAKGGDTASSRAGMRRIARLMSQVAEAVHYAHQRGILHRDLKPGNILLDSAGQPHVTDFGLAKRVESDSGLTVSGDVIGTPSYMAPEQAAGRMRQMTTTADVYSLGVILYELIAGRVPFRGATAMETLDLVRHSEPASPRVGNAAIPRDLETICLKCLEKDPAKRYGTAQELAVELNHFLADEPILARPVGSTERLWRWGRRRPALAGLGAAVILLLISVSIVSTVAARRATAARDAEGRERHAAEMARTNELNLRLQAQADEKKALTEAAKSQEVTKFLKDMLDGVKPAVAVGRDTKMLRDILDRTAARITNSLLDQPGVQAELLSTIGHAYYNLGENAKAESSFRASLVRCRQVFGERSTSVAGLLNDIGSTLAKRMDMDGAEAMHREALAMNRSLLGETNKDVAICLHDLASVLKHRGDLAGAEGLYRQALAIMKATSGEGEDVASVMDSLGILLSKRGDLAGARVMQLEALEFRKKVLGSPSPAVAVSMINLARGMWSRGDFDGAESLGREGLEMARKMYGENDKVAMAVANLAETLESKGDLPNAETLYREALAMRRRVFGDPHYALTISLNSLSQVQIKRGDLVGAEASAREALALLKRLFGEVHPDVATALIIISKVLRMRGDVTGADAMRAEAMEMRKALKVKQPSEAANPVPDKTTGDPGGSQDSSSSGSPRPRPVDAQKRSYPNAEEVSRQRALLQNRIRGMGDSGYLETTTLDLATLLADWARAEGTNAANYLELRRESDQLMHDYEAAARKHFGTDPRRLELTLDNVATFRSGEGQFAEAVAFLREILSSRKARLLPGNEEILRSVCSLSGLLSDWSWAAHTNAPSGPSDPAVLQRAREAEHLLRDALEPRLRGSRASHWRTADGQSRLGFALVVVAVSTPGHNTEERAALFAQAEKLLLDSHERLTPAATGTPKYQRNSAARLLRLYEAWNKPEEAARWRKELNGVR